MPCSHCCAGLGPNEAKEKPYIASMGIYVFKKDVLTKLLRDKYPQVLHSM